jgi:AcrR family transcriptional regulator
MGVMSHRPNRASPQTASSELRPRILNAAGIHFFAKGYRAFTMDDLASDLGMSKKTLYVWFKGKETIIRAVLDDLAFEIRTDADRLLADGSLSFTEKLRGFTLALMERLAPVTSEILGDLEESAPALHRYIEQLRSKNIPYIFGRFIEEGQIAGAVRDDVSPPFAGEFFLHAMQGLMQPSSLQKFRLRPDLVLDRALKLFFCGLLTPSGHKDYEKSFLH